VEMIENGSSSGRDNGNDNAVKVLAQHVNGLLKKFKCDERYDESICYELT
jgi:hypothetical protein